MLRSTHAGRSLLEVLLTLAVGLVPIASGLMVMSYQLDKKLEQVSSTSMREALFVIDRALDEVHQAALNALPLSGKPCRSVMYDLKELVAHNPHLHSLLLTRDGRVYCSSLATFTLKTPDFEPGQDVKLTFDVPTFSNEVMLEYRLPDQEPGVIASVYGLKLRSELNGFQSGLVLLLEFGDHYIWSGGDSREAGRPSQSEYFQRDTSATYGYTVNVGFPQGYRQHELLQASLQTLPSLALVGLLTSAFTYWGLFRSRKKAVHDATHK
ncbi:MULTISPECIES: CSS-motif domain-containing protein [unclassified Pseudomonas]|uniref:CSS-motif domain-containing protein n=1 Tax=unclassified Pseudomonas TaxID=196821 RepID=UPI0035BF3B88